MSESTTSRLLCLSLGFSPVQPSYQRYGEPSATMPGSSCTSAVLQGCNPALSASQGQTLQIYITRTSGASRLCISKRFPCFCNRNAAELVSGFPNPWWGHFRLATWLQHCIQVLYKGPVPCKACLRESSECGLGHVMTISILWSPSQLSPSCAQVKAWHRPTTRPRLDRCPVVCRVDVHLHAHAEVDN